MTGNNLLDTLIELSNTNRLLDLERQESGTVIRGDFEGTVTGAWVKLREDGAGIVTYREKVYVTVPLGITSITAGTRVELTHADGVYYSNY